MDFVSLAVCSYTIVRSSEIAGWGDHNRLFHYLVPNLSMRLCVGLPLTSVPDPNMSDDVVTSR